MANTIEIIIRTKDQTGGGLRAVSDNLKAIGTIALTAASAGLAAMGGAVALVARKAIPAASNLNEALNASSVVFEEAASQIQAFGETAAAVAGLSESEFNQMAAQTGAMLKNMGLSAAEAASQTIDLSKRAADMASIFNTDVNDAMMAIQAGLRGEIDPLERFGVSLSAAAVQAKAVELGLAGASGEMSDAAKIQGRLALLFEQTDAIAGDFVNTSDQLANATRVQQKRWENFMAQIGGVALPVLERLQNALNERIMPVLEGVGDSLEKFVDALTGGIDPITAIVRLAYNLGEAFGLSRDAISNVVGKVRELAGTFSSLYEVARLLITGDFRGGIFGLHEDDPALAALFEFREAVISLWDTVSQAIGSFISWKDVLATIGISIGMVLIPLISPLIAAIGGLIVTFAAVTAAIALVRTAWEENWFGIQDITAGVVSRIGEVINTFMTNLQTWWQQNGAVVMAALQTAWVVVQSVVTAAIETIKPVIQSLFETLKTSFEDFGPLMDQFKELWIAIEPIVAAVLAAIGALVLLAIGVIVGAFQGLAQAIGPLIETFKNVVGGIVQFLTGVADYVTGFVDLIVALFQGNTEGVMNAVEQMQSGVSNIWRGLVNTIGSLISGLVYTVLNFVDGLVSGVITFFTNLYNALVGGSIIPDMVNEIISWFGDLYNRAVELWTNLKDTVTELMTSLKEALITLATTFWTIGRDIIFGIRDGILQYAHRLISSVTGAIKNAIDAAKALLGITSPSKVFMEIGEQIGDGLIAGIQAKYKDVADTVKGLFDVAGALSGIGGSFGSVFGNRILDPLEAQLKDLDERIAELRGSTDWPAQMELVRLERERAELAEQYADAQERALRLQEQQQQLGFLETQFKLLELIRENALDPGEILGGLELGLGAGIEDLMDAMTRALQRLIEEANSTLGIASPSKVFQGIGEQLMQGLALGIQDGVAVPVRASMRAAEAVGAGATNQYFLTINEAGQRGNVIEDIALLRAWAR